MFKSQREEDCTKSPYDWSGGESVSRQESERVFTSIRHMIAPRELPEAESLSDLDLIALLNDIEFDLLQNKVRVDFLDTLPARVAYKGILQMIDSPVEMAEDDRTIRHIDGCDSACESCFQLAHCAVAKEVLGAAEWRLAVDQAGVNPSWTAIFGAESQT